MIEPRKGVSSYVVDMAPVLFERVPAFDRISVLDRSGTIPGQDYPCCQFVWVVC